MFVSGKHILTQPVSMRVQSAVITAQILLECLFSSYFLSKPYRLYVTDIQVEEHTVQYSDLKQAPVKAINIFIQQIDQILIIQSRSCAFSIYVFFSTC